MKISLITVLAALVVAGASPTLAQTSEQWTAFADETLSRYGDPTDTPDWEDLLYAAAEAHPDDPDAALDAFASSIGQPRDEAGRYALAVMQTVSFHENCRDDDCEPGDRDTVLAAIIAEARQEPSGGLLMVVGKRSLGAGDHASVLAAILAHSERIRILSDIYAYNENATLLALMVLEEPGAAAVLEALRSKPPEADGDPDHRDGWLLALLEEGQASLVRDGGSLGARAVYAQVILTHYLRLGLTDEAIAAWRGHTPALRDALPLVPPEGCGVPVPPAGNSARLPYSTCLERERGADLVDELAAALWTTGARTEAQTLIAHGEARLGGASLMGQAHAAVLDALHRQRSADSLFELYVDGDQTLPMPEYASFDRTGWLGLGYGFAGQRVVADRARAAGYESIAEAIASRQPYYRSEREQPVLAAMADAFPVSVRERQVAVSRGIESAWAAFPEQRDRIRVQVAVIPTAWTESRLAEGMTAWRDPEPKPQAEEDLSGSDLDEPELDAMFAEMEAGDPALPVSSYAVVRLDERGDERLLVYRDATFDLPGETGAYGLWFNRSLGGVWGVPVYLGLQENFPYVVTPESELPLLDGDRLQIEVRVREVDPESITFPPVGLRLKREEDGVVLTASLAELTRDGDADGIPDLVERRLNLDADNPDIDGDGILDGADPIPQVAYDPSISRGRTALARAILKRMMGYDAGAIVVPVSAPDEDLEDMVAAAIGRPPVPAPLDTFIVGGDPTLFAGLDLPFRLLVYAPEALRALTERGGPFYPPVVTIYSSLDGRHFVVWSASWVGGSFIAICDDGADACEIDERSSWIT